MHIFLGVFIFMLSSSLVMVGYVWIRDIKHKKSQPEVIADAAGDLVFEDIQPADTTVTEYGDFRKKTA